MAASDCPKVYIPNLETDPEQIGMDMDHRVTTLLNYLRRDVAKTGEQGKLLDFVLIDSKRGNYGSRLSEDLMQDLGVQVIDMTLISEHSKPHYDADLLVAALLSLT